VTPQVPDTYGGRLDKIDVVTCTAAAWYLVHVLEHESLEAALRIGCSTFQYIKMAPSLKDKVRSFLTSVLPCSGMDATGDSKSVPHLDVPMAIVVWVQLVMMCLRGWTSESVAMWQELTGYRLEKASHCKDINTCNEHEFVIYEFTNNHNHKLQLRSDRAAGELKDTTTLPSSSSSVESLHTDLEKSSPLAGFSSSQSSKSSLSLVSVTGSLSKISGSIRQAVRRLSNSSLSTPSAISSNQYLAADTITRINGHPSHSRVLRTVTFSGDRSSRPSLWDVMILINVVHKDSTIYTLFGRQCFWFADTIFASLEKWVGIYEVGSVKANERRKMWGRRRSSTGSLGGVLVHRRDSVHIDMIWDDFMKERHIMNEQVSCSFKSLVCGADRRQSSGRDMSGQGQRRFGRWKNLLDKWRCSS
jgi:hypothetical protein